MGPIVQLAFKSRFSRSFLISIRKTIFPTRLDHSVSSPPLPLSFSFSVIPFVFTLFILLRSSFSFLSLFLSFSLFLPFSPFSVTPYRCVLHHPTTPPRTLAIPCICDPRTSCRSSKSTFASHPTVKPAATTLPLSTRLTRICWQCPSSCRYDYFSRSVRFTPIGSLHLLPRSSSLEPWLARSI